MAQGHMVPPKAPPLLDIPQSDSIVKVSVVNSTSFVKLPIDSFLQPHYKGKDYLTGPTYCFFMQHPSGKHILFDLGIRKDWENLSPVLVDNFKKKKWELGAEKNIAEILMENGVDVAKGDIDTVIWSHHHWDHIGDLAGTFPPSTQLLVGPGFKSAHLPAYPINASSPLLQHDFEDRDVREIDIVHEGADLKIGRFNAYDYFGDGSFYLLDTPGHSVGHICGLARTTPDTFVFMGGDASHHGGEFRPSEYLPLPRTLDPSPIPKMSVCPGHLLQDIHREKSAVEPYYLVTESFAHDLEVCNWTIAGLQEFDANENVLLIVAHDDSVGHLLEFYPQSINHWAEKDMANKARWSFLADFGEALEDVKK